MTYETLVKRALARVPPTMDKREGSMVFNGVAPSMAELAQLYIAADFVDGLSLFRPFPFGNPVPPFSLVLYPFGPSPVDRRCSLLTMI